MHEGKLDNADQLMKHELHSRGRNGNSKRINKQTEIQCKRQGKADEIP